MTFPQVGPYNASETFAIAQLNSAGAATAIAALSTAINTARIAVGASISRADFTDLLKNYYLSNMGPNFGF